MIKRLTEYTINRENINSLHCSSRMWKPGGCLQGALQPVEAWQRVQALQAQQQGLEQGLAETLRQPELEQAAVLQAQASQALQPELQAEIPLLE